MIDDVTKECLAAVVGHLDLGPPRRAGTDGPCRTTWQARPHRQRPRHRVSPRTRCWPGAKMPACPGISSPRASRCKTASARPSIRKMRDELLNETLFFGLDHAREIVARWVADYNLARPHSALDYQTPAAFAAQLTAMGDQLHVTEAFRCSPIAPPRKRAIVRRRLWFQLDECRGSEQCCATSSAGSRRRPCNHCAGFSRSGLRSPCPAPHTAATSISISRCAASWTSSRRKIRVIALGDHTRKVDHGLGHRALLRCRRSLNNLRLRRRCSLHGSRARRW